MEVYPLLSLVRGWEILTIPGSLVNRRLMVFSLKNQSLFNSATVRCLFYRTRVLNDHLPERFFQMIDANWSPVYERVQSHMARYAGARLQ